MTAAGDLDLRHHAAGDGEARPLRWGKVIDQTRCIGCHACTTACKSENEVPLSVTRTYVKYVDVGSLPAGAARLPGDPLQPVRRRALRHRLPDLGDVPSRRTGSSTSTRRSASAARPASPPAPTTRSSSTRRTTRPRSATSARTASTSASSRRASWSARPQAILVGDLNDPRSRVAQIVRRDVGRGAPAREGDPAEALLQGRAPGDARSARRPPSGRRAVHVERAGRAGRRRNVGGQSRPPTSSAAALLSYDVSHRAPWDWRVSLYTWTKGIAAGAYLAALAARALGPARLGKLAVAVGRSGRGLVLPRRHRRDPDLGPRASRALPLHLPAPAVAQLARPRRGGRSRPTAPCSRLSCCCRRSDSSAAEVARDRRDPRGRRGRRLHGVPLRAGEGARPVAEPAARPAPARAGAAARRRRCSCHLPTGSRTRPSGRSSGCLQARRSRICSWLPGRPPSRTARLTLASRRRADARALRARGSGQASLLVAAALFAPLIGVVAVPLALLGLLAHEHAYVQAGQSVPLA